MSDILAVKTSPLVVKDSYIVFYNSAFLHILKLDEALLCRCVYFCDWKVMSQMTINASTELAHSLPNYK